MLDRTYTSVKSHENPFHSMRMSGYRTSELPGLPNKRLDLIHIKVCRGRHSAFHQHCTCDTDLDYVGTILHLLAYGFANFIRSISNAVHTFILIRSSFGD